LLALAQIQFHNAVPGMVAQPRLSMPCRKTIDRLKDNQNENIEGESAILPGMVQYRTVYSMVTTGTIILSSGLIQLHV
jgi:hypothetical protein